MSRPRSCSAPGGGEALVIADIASPISRTNVQATGRACVSFIDVFAQKGYKVEGVASYHSEGAEDFAIFAADLLARAEGRFPIKGVVRVTPTGVTPIIAPTYRLFPDIDEDAMRAESYTTYGVRPL